MERSCGDWGRVGEGQDFVNREEAGDESVVAVAGAAQGDPEIIYCNVLL